MNKPHGIDYPQSDNLILKWSNAVEASKNLWKEWSNYVQPIQSTKLSYFFFSRGNDSMYPWPEPWSICQFPFKVSVWRDMVMTWHRKSWISSFFVFKKPLVWGLRRTFLYVRVLIEEESGQTGDLGKGRLVEVTLVGDLSLDWDWLSFNNAS